MSDYADAYILGKGTITIAGAWDAAAERQADERDKGVTFKNWAPFTKCISRINNSDIDTAQDIDIVMPMYNLIEYSDHYSKTSGRLWQYCKDEPNDSLADSESFKSKVKSNRKNSQWWEFKKFWNNCAIKIFKEFLENSRNAN